MIVVLEFMRVLVLGMYMLEGGPRWGEAAAE